MGVVVVAARAARTAAGPTTRIAFTFRGTRSVAIGASKAALLSVVPEMTIT
jgi:hypothetical protein